MTELRAPFIWFGGKRRVADIVWRAFGNAPNYVEPFFGSGAVLLKRPHAPKLETVNDVDCMLVNFWRALLHAPDEVARFADWPVNEADLHARHRWLVGQLEALRARVTTDPDYFDAKIAGWWVWGLCAWIGYGWCDPRRVNSRQLPILSAVNSGGGNGVHAAHAAGPMPAMSGFGRGIHTGHLPAIGHSGRAVHSPEVGPLVPWFRALAARLRRVRVTCGDWARIVSGAVTGATNTRANMGMSPCAVFLDPPYADEAAIYGHYIIDPQLSARVREWAIANGDNPKLRIALCGYEGEHVMPASWRVLAWKAQGGYGNRNGDAENENAHRERIWFSPHCLPFDDVQTSLPLLAWDEP